MSTVLQFPESVKNTAPSTRLVYAALESHGPSTLEEITSRTGVARRTAKRALSTLRDEGLAAAEAHPTDARRRVYASTSCAVEEDLANV